MVDTPFDASRISAACVEHLTDLTESLERCFEGIGVLEPGEPAAWKEPPEAFFGPGILVRVETSGGTILGLIPASFPLPAWYATPGEPETARLATMALEWAEHLAPTDVTIMRSRAEPIEDLITAVTPLANEDAFLTALNPEGCEGDTLRTIYVLACPAVPEPAAPPEPVKAAAPQQPEFEPTQRPREVWRETPGDDVRRERLSRVLRVPVQVVVRLAEKKVELDQLLTLGPGSLITFDKNCEDLLDLYVNNRFYGRGEAVKIGEHFGVKIDEVGSVRQREVRVF